MIKVLIILLSLGLFACSQMGDNNPPSIPKTAAPDFTFELFQGGQLTKSELKGKWIVFNIWATWCPPCVREIPDFVALQEEFAKKNVQFIGISIDERGAEEVQSFIQRFGINYPILMSNINSLTLQFGPIDAIPTTFIMDPDGYFVNRHTGILSADNLRSELKTLISSRKD